MWNRFSFFFSVILQISNHRNVLNNELQFVIRRMNTTIQNVNNKWIQCFCCEWTFVLCYLYVFQCLASVSRTYFFFLFFLFWFLTRSHFCQQSFSSNLKEILKYTLKIMKQNISLLRPLQGFMIRHLLNCYNRSNVHLLSHKIYFFNRMWISKCSAIQKKYIDEISHYILKMSQSIFLWTFALTYLIEWSVLRNIVKFKAQNALNYYNIMS